MYCVLRRLTSTEFDFAGDYSEKKGMGELGEQSASVDRDAFRPCEPVHPHQLPDVTGVAEESKPTTHDPAT